MSMTEAEKKRVDEIEARVAALGALAHSHAPEEPRPDEAFPLAREPHPDSASFSTRPPDSHVGGS